MKTILSILEKRRPSFIWWLSVLCVVIICCVIALVVQHVDISPLIVIPVLLVSWYGTSRAGVKLAIFSAFSLLITNAWLVYLGIRSASPTYNSLVILFVCLLVAIVVTNFKKVHVVEVVAADTDTLTGVNSLRSFYAGIANEILRSNRYGHKFSLAYIDVDNFKHVNDTFGHAVGDKLLIELSKCLMSTFRLTDTVARVGGDEFVCLLPETGQNEAKAAILKAEKSLKESMKLNKWDVSFSIGVVTFEALPDDVHEAVKIADELMYFVKSNKKNDIAYRVWRGGA